MASISSEELAQQVISRALGRLSQLAEQAQREQLYGTVAVEITYRNGVPETIRRKVDATEK